ncbi:MAG TPA: hypothetical protein VIM73_22700 [Polyangiaceae bacterium]
MNALALTLLALHGLVISIDEVHHRQRGLPRWERIGHPMDTASVLACYLVALLFEPARTTLVAYAVLAAFSCLLITKDEFVHARRCEPTEHWLHALLFVLHPLILIAAALLWLAGERLVLSIAALSTALFGLYQSVYWNWFAAPDARRRLGTHGEPTTARSPQDSRSPT